MIPYVLVYCDSLYSYVRITKLEEIIMETSLALTIIGIVLTLVGIIFNAIPKIVNQKIMGGLAPEAENPAAALRVAIGGISIAVGIIALYCKDFPVDQASALLVAMGTGFIVIIAAIISMKFRGFSDEVAIPPVVMFIILTIIAFYASS